MAQHCLGVLPNTVAPNTVLPNTVWAPLVLPQHRGSNPAVEAEYQSYPAAGRLTSLLKGVGPCLPWLLCACVRCRPAVPPFRQPAGVASLLVGCSGPCPG